MELIDANFAGTVPIPPSVATSIHARLAALGVSGGAVFHALVALAAHAAHLPLATRDGRATVTYAALGAEVEPLDG